MWLAGAWQRIRRALSRDQWAVRLLRLPFSPEAPGQAGLVLIQIDGLSRFQFERALRRRRLPFLRRLLRRKKYRLTTFYSGLPSATPMVQGELFYGVPCAVPSFQYRDGQTGRAVRMFDPTPAAKVQARLSRLGEGLLRNGSAYCDIYSGGAKEPHFCPSEWGYGMWWRAVHPVRFAVFLLLYFDGAIRVAGMMLAELALAIVDCARGLVAGRHLWKELGLVPLRVTVGVLLRELIVVGARLDMARGLPVIHLNFLGYDEQSHRRGPGSAFAHWSLRGIDRAVRRVWRATRRANRCKYQVWIYSDHGQEDTVSYEETVGRTLQAAVAAVFRGDAAGESAEGRRRSPVEWHPISTLEVGGARGSAAAPSRPRTGQRFRAAGLGRGSRGNGHGVAGATLLPGVRLFRPTRRDCPTLGRRGRNPAGPGCRRSRPCDRLDVEGVLFLASRRRRSLGRRASVSGAGGQRFGRDMPSSRGRPVCPGWLGGGAGGEFFSRERRPRRSHFRRDASLRPLPQRRPAGRERPRLGAAVRSAPRRDGSPRKGRLAFVSIIPTFSWKERRALNRQLARVQLGMRLYASQESAS